MLERAAGVVEGLVVYPDRMRQNLERSGGLFYSEAVMLALVHKGLPRQRAYEVVQRSAMAAFSGEGVFRELLGRDDAVKESLSASELDECFDLDHALRFSEELVARALRS
jgi:adenylosuccinate lyase